MLEPTSRPVIETRSARFLKPTRPVSLRTVARIGILLPNMVRLAELIQLVFPDAKELEIPIQIDNPDMVHDLVCQFLEIVNTLYFPVKSISWHFGSLHPALQGRIPLKPLGFDNWSSQEEDPVQLMTALADVESGSDQAIENLCLDYPEFKDLPLPFGFSRLPKLIEQMNLTEPLSFLPDLIKICASTTGSFFLDNSPANFEFYQERGAGIEWSKKNVAWLKADWERAKPIHERAWRLINWTREEKEDRTAVLMGIILEAHGSLLGF